LPCAQETSQCACPIPSRLSSAHPRGPLFQRSGTPLSPPLVTATGARRSADLPAALPPVQTAGSAPSEVPQDFHVAVYSAQQYVLDYLQRPLEAALGAEHVRVRALLASFWSASGSCDPYMLAAYSAACCNAAASGRHARECMRRPVPLSSASAAPRLPPPRRRPPQFIEARLDKDTAELARGCTAVCLFVNDICDSEVQPRRWVPWPHCPCLRPATRCVVGCRQLMACNGRRLLLPYAGGEQAGGWRRALHRHAMRRQAPEWERPAVVCCHAARSCMVASILQPSRG
jgi:hypothetical protein